MTKEQWFSRLQSWVPPNIFSDPKYQKAIFYGIAKALEQAELSANQTVRETFIQESTDYLALHGNEREIEPLPNESPDLYRYRIRHLQNVNNEDVLFYVIKFILNNGEPIMIENYNHGFADDDTFYDYKDAVYLSKTKTDNIFTILIPQQTGGDEEEIKSAILSVVNNNKTFGVMYEIAYGVET